MQRSRVLGVGLVLLFLTLILSACTGAAPIAQDWPGLTVDDGSVYVVRGAPLQVYVLDAATGVQQGVTFSPLAEARSAIYGSAVTLGGGLAYVGLAEERAGTARLYAFDPATRQERWAVEARNLIIAAPTYAQGGADHPSGVVYFGDTSGRVYAVDAENGAILSGWPFRAQEAIWASPLVAGDRVYAASMDHRVYALDATTGVEIWSTSVGAAVASPPALDESQGILYVGAFDGRVHALRADSGEMIDGFQFQAGNWIWSQPLLADDVLYVTALDGRLYALDRTGGEVVSPYPYDAGELTGGTDVLRSAPVDAGDGIVITTESGRAVMVSNAQRRWVWPVSGVPEAQIYTTPVAAGDLVYVVFMNGQVYALSVETGEVVWRFPLAEAE